MSKCPDCGGDEIVRLPCFADPKYKRAWLQKAGTVDFIEREQKPDIF